MATSSLQKSEADLACPAGQAAASDPLPAVDEQLLALTAAGAVQWNGSEFRLLEGPAGHAALLARLRAFRETCAAAGSEPSLRIQPEGRAPHQALVTLLDAVNASGIEAVHFP